ncbi:MAG: RHS repeat-associated core domain-containing protein [Campylobacterota bacterium]
MAKLKNGVVVEKYLWNDLTTLLAIYDGNDNLVQRFNYADGRMPIGYEDGTGSVYYIAYNHVGSPRVVADAFGRKLKTLSYDSFGNIVSDSNPSLKIPFGFAGGLYDPDTGLTRFGYRDYDAYTGKWTAKDPIGFQGGDTNLYGYVLGDPVNFVDPLGLYGTEDCSYYDDECQEGYFYYCDVAPELCPNFPTQNIISGWTNCMRQCLQEYDDQVGCSECSDAGTFACQTAAHTNCALMCIVSPDDPIWDGQ